MTNCKHCNTQKSDKNSLCPSCYDDLVKLGLCTRCLKFNSLPKRDRCQSCIDSHPKKSHQKPSNSDQTWNTKCVGSQCKRTSVPNRNYCQSCYEKLKTGDPYAICHKDNAYALSLYKWCCSSQTNPCAWGCGNFAVPFKDLCEKCYKVHCYQRQFKVIGKFH